MERVKDCSSYESLVWVCGDRAQGTTLQSSAWLPRNPLRDIGAFGLGIWSILAALAVQYVRGKFLAAAAATASSLVL